MDVFVGIAVGVVVLAAWSGLVYQWGWHNGHGAGYFLHRREELEAFKRRVKKRLQDV